MTVFIATYVHSIDAECIIDDVRDRADMMSQLLCAVACVPVIATTHADALDRIVKMLADEIADDTINDPDEPEMHIPAPTVANCVIVPDHEYSSSTTTVYAYDVEPRDFFVRIVIVELTPN